MDYTEALHYLHAAPRFKGKASCERMRRLCALLGDPQRRGRFVHVAGTNGKGSVCQMIAAALRGAGYRTGLFTSPFVVDFRERMQIDGRMIERGALARVASRVREAARALESEGFCATEFELVTACGLLWFAEEACDCVVLEVGLGGRFDATNVIDRPDCAVITKIALDHTAILGDTLGQIAFEKCGIIKGGAVVCYPEQPPEALEVIRRRCAEEGARLIIPALPISADVSLERCRFTLGDDKWDIPLGGAHQIANAVTALAALDVLGVPHAPARAGIAALRFPGRLERIGDVIIDGAHNPDGAAALAHALGGTPRTVIFSAMRDKEFAPAANTLLDGARRFIACALPMERAAQPWEILVALRPRAETELWEAPCAADALRIARQGLREGERIVVCGSLYLAAEARALLVPPESDGSPSDWQ